MAAPEDDWSDVDLAQPASAPAAPASAGEPLLDFEPEPLAAEPPPAAPAPIEIPEAPATELQLAPLHEFVPPVAATGHQPEPKAAPPATPAVVQGGAGFTPGGATPAVDGGEAALREALGRASREVIERVVWEVVPELAETIIRENLERLVKARQA